jgi:hypothetical protein
VVRKSNPAEKISKTALLAGAALAFPVVSKADIVYVTPSSTPSGTETLLPFQVSSPQASTTDSPLTLSFTIDGVTPFTFTADGGIAGSGDTVEDTVTGTSTSGWVGPLSDTFGDASPLMAGTDIGVGLSSTSAFYGGTGILQKTEDPLTENMKGPWPTDGSSAYLGIEFNPGDGTHYGWIQLSACTPDDPTTDTTNAACNADPSIINVSSYAYQSVAGVDILAGDTGAVPEPSSIVLFALGAAGLVAYRRRKLAA